MKQKGTASHSGSGNRIARTILLQSNCLSLLVHPGAGGNISELKDTRTGRNWLWRNPAIPISDERCGEDYGHDLDSGGWDEILFSVSPDDLGLAGNVTRQIPDHGDLVRRQWSLRSEPDEGRSCTLDVTGDSIRYRFSRTITLAEHGPQMKVSYELVNEDRFSWPWYWCAHVLLEVQSDTRVHLPGSKQFRVDSSTGKLAPAKQIQRWPTIDNTGGTTIDLSRSFTAGNPPFASKIFVESPENGIIAVRTPNNEEALTMTFDPKKLPWLGLWINNRGWCGRGSKPYRNLGLEPATAPYDSVVEAVANHAVPWLEPGEVRQWSLVLEFTA